MEDCHLSVFAQGEIDHTWTLDNVEMTIYCFDKQRSQASWSSTWSRFACCLGFRSKARNKISRLLNLDSNEVCDLRLEIETSNNRKFH